MRLEDITASLLRTFGETDLLAVVAGLGLVGSASAQNRDGAWEVRPFGGYVRFGSEAGLKDSPSFGFSFGYHWTKKNEIEFMYSGTSTHDQATGAFSADLITAQASYIRNFFLRCPFIRPGPTRLKNWTVAWRAARS